MLGQKTKMSSSWSASSSFVACLQSFGRTYSEKTKLEHYQIAVEKIYISLFVLPCFIHSDCALISESSVLIQLKTPRSQNVCKTTIVDVQLSILSEPT